MKKYDQYLLENGYTLEELVDKASHQLLKYFKDYHSVSILCGPGNNGADGLSLAYKLRKLNKDVTVFVLDINVQSKAYLYYLDKCKEEDIKIIKVDKENLEDLDKNLLDSEVIVDALFGFGLDREISGIYLDVIKTVNSLSFKDIIAVDIPSGLQCDKGVPFNTAIKATQTITFCALKNGFLNPQSFAYTGKVFVEELQVDDIYKEVGLFELFDEQIAIKMIKERKHDGYKGKYGHVGLIVGSKQYTGAALLASKGALYSGSGLVSTITDDHILSTLNISAPEIIGVPKPSTFDKHFLEKYDALLLGSGLSLTIEAHLSVGEVLKQSKQPLVIDGDALTILSSQLDYLKTIQREVVLTPHLGEFKRLCDYDENSDLLEVAKKFAHKYHVTLVLKGPNTIVTNGVNAYRISSGNKAMSVAGMGDTLAGMITSFLGQGYVPLEAAALAVYIHGACGDLIAQDQYTVLPSLLIKKIPHLMFELVQKK